MVKMPHSRARVGSIVTLAFGLALVVVAFGAAWRAQAEGVEGADCLTVRGEARMQAYGYAHVVTVTNACRREARCEVWTSADPTPRHRLIVRAGETGSVTTRIGSPAREVVPGHQCELH
jgi:hypothetical protein